MKLAGVLAAIVVLALLLPFFVPVGGPAPEGDPAAALPWQIEVDGAGGSSVFGLRPGVSTLADVRRRFGRDLAVAIVAAPGEAGSLEGYYDHVSLGFVVAKLVVTLEAAPATIAAMRERAVDSKYMESVTRRMTLHPDDLALVERMPVRALSVIPAVSLDDAAVVQRFGQPQERIAVSAKQTHLLYPARGLDVVVDSEGKELFQYVAPRAFEALLGGPLRAKKAAAAAG